MRARRFSARGYTTKGRSMSLIVKRWQEHTKAAMVLCGVLSVTGARASSEPAIDHGTKYSDASPLFSSPDDLWIGASKRKDPRNGGVFLYGPTDPSASWYVTQWNNPGSDLLPFDRSVLTSGSVLYEAKATAVSVKLEKKSTGTEITLNQDAGGMPCELASHDPGEFDVLVGMNHPWVNRSHPDATLIDGKLQHLDQISNMASLLQVVTVRSLSDWLPYAAPRCKINQGNLMSAVVLEDQTATPVQTLYYQLMLHSICHAGATYERCQAHRMQRGFFWPGIAIKGPNGHSLKNFGYRDTLVSYDQAMLNKGETRTFSLELLPVLSTLLRLGEHGLDSDLSHWHVISAYFGQNIWGDVGLSSTWKSYDMRAVPVSAASSSRAKDDK